MQWRQRSSTEIIPLFGVRKSRLNTLVCMELTSRTGPRPEWVHLPWDRTLNGEERKEEGKIAQRDNDSEVAQALAEVRNSLALHQTGMLIPTI
jgi:hypothetical protein